MFDSLAKALAAGLELWSDKEKTKYQDQLIKLKRGYNDEYNKPVDERNDAVLDHYKFELRLLADSFSTRVGTPNVKV